LLYEASVLRSAFRQLHAVSRDSNSEARKFKQCPNSRQIDG
jgi:hypothetical protein